MVAACLAALSLANANAGETINVIPSGDSRPPDLAGQASAESLPQVSAAILRTQIQQERDPAKRLEISRRLVALLVAGGRHDEALAVCASPGSEDDPVLAYWKAEALAGAGDDASSRQILQKIVDSGVPVPGIPGDLLILSLSRALRGSGDPASAVAVLERIPPDSPHAEDALLEKAAALLSAGKTDECLELTRSATLTGKESKAAAAYLAALATWRAGNLTDAARLFAAVPPATPWISSASALGAALCLSASARDAKASSVLEKHLESVDDAPLIDREFRLLDRLAGQSGAPSASSLPYAKWAQDRTRPVRAKYAAFFDARRRHREDPRGGASRLQAFVDSHPDDPLSDEARLLLALSALRQGRNEEASRLVADRSQATPKLRARYAYVRGLSSAAEEKKEAAASEFAQAGVLDPGLAGDALFNKAVLAASSATGRLDVSRQAREIAELDAGLPSEEMRFQIALDLARRGDPSGEGMIVKVAESATDPAVKSRARLASAEIAMKSGKGEAAAADFAQVLRQNSGEPEREEYLGVFLKDTGRKTDASAVITAAKAFLAAHPDSRFVPEVRLKLAESLLASGDVQGARLQFEQLASAGGSSELGRRALFLAAQSAVRSMDPSSIDDSLMLLERVAGNGAKDSLAWQARLQQGAIKNAQNLPREALAIYEKILAAPDTDAEIRAAALMAKGDTLHQLATEEPSRDRDAALAWGTLASDRSLPLRWRNQALCKQGMILEKLGDGDAALAAYYKAFKNPRDGDPEQLWHDKAAFEAARLLGERKQWNDALSLYRQLVAEGGPRTEEANARLSKLKLENFLWEN